MTAKREIYARLGVQLRGNRRAFKAERLAPGAMGLYAFMVMDARAELPEQDGFVAEEVALSAWGRPADERLAQAEALCAVDLIERTAGGFVVVKYDEHNDCRKTVEKNKKATRLRVAKYRKDVTRYTPVTDHACNADVPSSISSSLSLVSSSGSQIASPSADMPAWFDASCDAAAMAIGGEVGERPARWVEYLASRTRKSWAPGHTDAVGWLTTVIRSERAKVRASPGAKHVQSAENRAWIVPKDMP